MKTTFGEELYKGDLILIAYTNISYLGIYLGGGSENKSVQYYTLDGLCYWIDNHNVRKYLNTKSGYPIKLFINNPFNFGRINKYLPELLDEEWREKYEKSINILKELKII